MKLRTLLLERTSSDQKYIDDIANKLKKQYGKIKNSTEAFDIARDYIDDNRDVERWFEKNGWDGAYEIHMVLKGLK